MLFIEYPKCTTCRKVREWLESAGVRFDSRHIKDERPSVDELRRWHSLSGLPLRRFFNTSGQLYRQLELKDRLPSMTEDEQLELLASDGMLVKRPLLVGEDFVLAGFKEGEWKSALGLE